ncbi:MAG: hypothetical protein FWB91_09860 [Defluviitaleaceae bacterium]|nr:hypothetical protein [Defluviitaleaceae bacterium]
MNRTKMRQVGRMFLTTLMMLLVLTMAMPSMMVRADGGDPGSNGGTPDPPWPGWPNLPPGTVIPPGNPGLPGPPGPPGADAPPPINPLLRMVSANNIAVEPGETIEVIVTLRNVGTDVAHHNFTVASTSAEAPFSVEFLNNSNSIRRINANAQANLAMRITVDANATPGSSHTITLDHFYRDENNHTHDGRDTINVRIVGEVEEVGEPVVRLRGFQTEAGMLSPGQTFTVVANIENTGNREARDVQVSPVSTDNIFFTGDASQFVFRTMAVGQSSQLHFTFQTDRNINSGTFRLDFIVSYRDENGNRMEDQEFEFRVHVYAPEEDEDALTNLEIRNIVSPTGRLTVGQTGTQNITFYLYNIGDSEVRNIQVQAQPEAALLPASQPIIIVPALAPGQGVPMEFSFSVSSDLATQTRIHTVRFNVSDRDGSLFDRVASISVYNPTREDDEPGQGLFQIPRVIVSEYSVYPAIPRAGQPFDMEITFRNTNSRIAVNNVRITLIPATEGDRAMAVFTPIGGSNTIFIDFIPPNGEVTKNLRFFTIPDVMPRAYTLRVLFDYQDEEMRSHDAEEQLSISVAQRTSLEAIWRSPIPPSVSVGDMVFFEFQATNTGRVDLNNVRVRMEAPDAPWEVGSAGMYLGPIRAQGVIHFSGHFTPWEAGEFQGTVIIYGEDATEDIVEYRHEFTLFVDEGWGMGGDWPDAWGDGGRDPWFDDGWGMDEWEEPLGYWNEYGEWVYFDDGFDFVEFIRRPAVWIPAAAVALAAVIAAVVIVRKKRSKLDFDDDDL